MRSDPPSSSDLTILHLPLEDSCHDDSVAVPRSPKISWKNLIAMAGLPCLISVAAIDPGNLEVDLQAGSLLRYHLIWALLLSSVIGWVLQTLSAHLTILTGSHLAELCARAYRHDALLSRSIFIFAELSIIAFDVAEVVGTAFALQLLFHWPLWLGMLMSAFDTMLVLYLQRNGLTKVELIIEGMLFILAACLFYEFALSRPQFSAMVQGAFVPTLGDAPREGAILAIGILGSVIMSHNLFLHSWLVKERRRGRTEPALSPASSVCRAEWARADAAASCRYATIEAGAIFVATFLINACVVSVTAALPREALASMGEIGLKDAGALLRNVLGTKFASTAWGVALLASGHAATVTGTLSSQAVCEGFLDVREGTSSAAMVLATRAVAIVPALVAALLAGEAGSDRLIVLSQVLLSLALPFAVIPVFKLFVYADRGRPVHSTWLVRAGYLAFALLIAANGFAIVEVGRQLLEESGVVAFDIVAVVVFLAIALMVKLVVTPVQLTDYDNILDRLCSASEKEKLLSGEQTLYL